MLRLENARGQRHSALWHRWKVTPQPASASDSLTSQAASTSTSCCSSGSMRRRLRDVLMYLPEMTEDVADAILDWVDDDEEPRDYAEPKATTRHWTRRTSRRMRSLNQSTSAAAGGRRRSGIPLRRGTRTATVCSTNEDDGDQSLPFDNADGVLNPGWAACLTVDGRGVESAIDGSPKVLSMRVCSRIFL